MVPVLAFVRALAVPRLGVLAATALATPSGDVVGIPTPIAASVVLNVDVDPPLAAVPGLEEVTEGLRAEGLPITIAPTLGLDPATTAIGFSAVCGNHVVVETTPSPAVAIKPVAINAKDGVGPSGRPSVIVGTRPLLVQLPA